MQPRNNKLVGVKSHIPSFDDIRASAQAQPPALVPASILALDPGQTVGWATATDGSFTVSGQLPEATFSDLRKLIGSFKPDLIIMEKYVLYPWKADEQGYSSFFTPRIIGTVETFAWEHVPQIPIGWQGAGQGKGFCTDDKLKSWGFFNRGKKHANDATRHMCYFLLFGKKTPITSEPRPWKHDG